MKYTNKATLIGRVGNVDYKTNNVVSLTLATHEYSKDKDGKYHLPAAFCFFLADLLAICVLTASFRVNFFSQ